jgi:hypothetical protein
METIRNYLETMFANMPNTPEVKKAKAELLSMMEDKFNEMIADGVNENQAVGTVIAEFGNLDELAADLGLTKEVEATHEREESKPRHFLRMEEVEDYLNVAKGNGLLIGIGVLLCITSVTWPILFEFLLRGQLGDGLGVTGMFISIAIAVALFVFAGIRGKDWEFLDKELCQIDMATADMVKSKKRAFKVPHAVIISVAIMLFILWIPTAAIDVEIVSNCLFYFIGVGVFMIIYASTVMGSYEKVLKLNDSKTISGSYGKDKGDIVYINKFAEGVMEVYWPTITCLYLIISFVTMDWHITWVIWPIAAIAHRLLEVVLAAEED